MRCGRKKGASVAEAFAFTERQRQAQGVIAGAASRIMLEGGSRSGKTFLHIRNIVVRALKAPNSRHLVLRFRFNHLKTTVVHDTFPAVMRKCFAGVAYDLSRTDWFVKFANGSEIWFGGLDDSDRMEKILGSEYVTILLNECSEISWEGVQMVITRLAQRVYQKLEGGPDALMRPRLYMDCNPPAKGHWTFRVFHQLVDPITKEPLANPDDWACFKINPKDNQANLSPEYLAQLASLSPRMRRRFELGEYAEETPNALFPESTIDKWRVLDGRHPDFIRVVVGVDPSGAGDEDNADNDEIGIVVGALGTDGNAYCLEDVSVKAGPATWGKVATDAYERHRGDCVVAETNFGGEMVRATIQASRPRTPFKKLVASRGKAVRAEPFSALYEQGKIRHLGLFPKLEDEMTAFSTVGYTGSGSPNRADAWIWVLSELFPGIIAGPKKEKPKRERGMAGVSWMG